MISTVSLAAVLLRSTQNTCAPSRANVTAVALPLPQPGPIQPAPPTIAILALSRCIDFSLFNVVEACSPDEANGSRECAPDDKLRAIRDSFHVESPGFRKCFILATDLRIVGILRTGNNPPARIISAQRNRRNNGRFYPVERHNACLSRSQTTYCGSHPSLHLEPQSRSRKTVHDRRPR